MLILGLKGLSNNIMYDKHCTIMGVYWPNA